MAKTKKKNEARAEQWQLARDCVVLKNKLGEAGLFRTMHQMDLVTRVIGWEIADQVIRAKGKKGRVYREA